MVDRITNGTFSQVVGSGNGANPADWTVTEPVSSNSIWVYNGRVYFNRGDSSPTGSISQTVSDILPGRPVTFSFTYGEVGVAADVTGVTYTVTRIAPNGDETVQLGPTRIDSAGSVSETFTPPAGGPYSYRITFADSSTGTAYGRDAYIDNVVFDAPVCFTKGTMIGVEGGAVPVETIRVGDLIMTADHGLQPVRWIGRRHISAAILAVRPNFRPIRIAAGALGAGRPAADLTVSPQHRLLISSAQVRGIAGTDEVLVAAKHLLHMPGIEITEPDGVDYFHILFDRHEVVYANGGPAESLYLGRQALKSLSPEGRAEVMALFPELRDMDEDEAWPACRPFLKGRDGRRLARCLAAAA